TPKAQAAPTTGGTVPYTAEDEDPGVTTSRPAHSNFNPYNCLVSFLAFEALSNAALGMEVAGLTLQGQAVVAWGVTFGAATPVTVGGVLLGAVFEVAGGLTEAYAVYVLTQGCAAG